MKILREIFEEIIKKQLILLIFLLCASCAYTASIRFYIVTSAVLNASEISSQIFFSSLNLALEDAIMNTSKNITKNFTIYLSGADTNQTSSTLDEDTVVDSHFDNSLNITVTPFPCETNDATLSLYLSHCAKKRPKILVNNQDTVFIGSLSSLTLKGFDMLGKYSTTFCEGTIFNLYCDINDCKERNFRISFENMTLSFVFFSFEILREEMDIIPNFQMSDVDVIW